MWHGSSWDLCQILAHTVVDVLFRKRQLHFSVYSLCEIGHIPGTRCFLLFPHPLSFPWAPREYHHDCLTSQHSHLEVVFKQASQVHSIKACYHCVCVCKRERMGLWRNEPAHPCFLGDRQLLRALVQPLIMCLAHHRCIAETVSTLACANHGFCSRWLLLWFIIAWSRWIIQAQDAQNKHNTNMLWESFYSLVYIMIRLKITFVFLMSWRDTWFLSKVICNPFVRINT